MNAVDEADGRAPDPAIYEIRIRGHLDSERWREWFDEMTLTQAPNGDTLLTGPVADQAALHGLLRKLRNLNLPLTSINELPPSRPNQTD